MEIEDNVHADLGPAEILAALFLVVREAGGSVLVPGDKLNDFPPGKGVLMEPSTEGIRFFIGDVE